MGSTQSFISYETALTTLVVAGAIGLGYSKIGNVSNSSPQIVARDSGGGKKEKKKKAKKSSISETKPVESISTSEATVAAFHTAVPGGFEAVNTTAEQTVSKPKKAKKKKSKAAAAATGGPTTSQVFAASADYTSESSIGSSQRKTKRPPQAPSSSTPIIRPLQQSSLSIDTDGSWTRVESGRRSRGATSTSEGPAAELTASDAGITTPVTGNSSPLAERIEYENTPNNLRDNTGNRRTLAERLLPKPRKTGVDDMLETPDYPTLSRVMRVQPLPDEQPASGFSWGDYENAPENGGGNDADGEDDGWGIVKNKSRPKIDRSSSAQKQTQSSEELTKRQRQNARKREEMRASKAEAEADRLATLAKHKRELERTRMLEQYGKSGGSKNPSGGMKATVDERGKLVWE